MDFIALAAVVVILIPQLRIKIHQGTKDMFFSLFKFGSIIQVVGIAELINAQVDKILLGALRSVSAVGLYEVGAKIANVANYLPSVILPILNPTTSDLYARGREEEVNFFYKKGIKVLSVIMLPITCIVVVHAESIILLWIGQTGFESSAVTARFLVIGISFYMIAGVGRLMARGMAMPHYEMQAGLIISILNIISSYFMIIKWGITGAVISSSISLLIGSVFFLWRFNDKIKLPNKKIFWLLLNPAFFSVIAVLPTLFLPAPLKFDLLGKFSLRVQSFIYLSIVLAIFLGLYVFFLHASGLVKEEIQMLLCKSLSQVKNVKCSFLKTGNAISKR